MYAILTLWTLAKMALVARYFWKLEGQAVPGHDDTWVKATMLGLTFFAGCGVLGCLVAVYVTRGQAHFFTLLP